MLRGECARQAPGEPPALAVPLPQRYPQDTPDHELVQLIRAGSLSALAVVDQRYRVHLLAYVRRMLGPDEAEDVLQDVFVRAHRALTETSAPIELRPWLYRIARNRCIDELRTRRPLPLIDQIETGAAARYVLVSPPHEPAAVAERAALLSHTISDIRRLPERQRAALALHVTRGYSYLDTGRALGVSVASVKALLHRARAELRAFARARDTPCSEIRHDLETAARDHRRPDDRARRHCAECTSCAAHRARMVRAKHHGRSRAMATGPR